MRAEGELLSECVETGLGYRWAGNALGDLEQHHPSTGDKCEHFQVGAADPCPAVKSCSGRRLFIENAQAAAFCTA